MFKAQTAAEISRQLNGAFQAEMPGSNPYIWPSNLAVIRKVLAQAFRGVELRLEWLHRQRFVSLCEAEYLDLHATDEGLARLPALYASGAVMMITVPGTVILPLTELTHGSITYITMAEITATTTVTSVQVRATEPGVTGNVDPGATLTLTEATVGVGTVTVSPTGIVGGAEVESDDSLRERILYNKRNPPAGGSPSEYIEWARQKPGVTRVWVNRATPQPGSVTIYFAMDLTYANGIPGDADVASLLSLLEDFAPADADVIVRAPAILPVNITISNLVPDTHAIRDAVLAEVQAMFLRRAAPGQVFARDWIAEAISSVPGWQRHFVEEPLLDIFPAPGQLPVLGVLGFIPDAPYY